MKAALRAAALVLALIVTFAVAAPIQWLARRYGWRIHSVLQTGFSRLVCVIIGIRIAPLGALPGDAPRLVVANHVSWTDILALASLHPFTFVAKREVRGWPVLGWLARLQGTIFVDRGSRRGLPAVNAALAQALRQGCDVVLFAEGTSSDGASVLRFNAAHFAALDAAPQAVIAPAAIAYLPRSQEAAAVDAGWYGDMSFVPHLWKLMRSDGLRCQVAFGAPLAARADRKALAMDTQARVRALLDVARMHDAEAIGDPAPNFSPAA